MGFEKLVADSDCPAAGPFTLAGLLAVPLAWLGVQLQRGHGSLQTVQGVALAFVALVALGAFFELRARADRRVVLQRPGEVTWVYRYVVSHPLSRGRARAYDSSLVLGLSNGHLVKCPLGRSGEGDRRWQALLPELEARFEKATFGHSPERMTKFTRSPASLARA